MSNFCPDQGRTRVFDRLSRMYLAGRRTLVRRGRKPAENAEQGKKGHLWMDTDEFFGNIGIGVNFLNIIAIFKGFHQADHLLCFLALKIYG